jgi:mannose-6-phosphate isomerase-like protein (cupin superfamily)
VLAEGGENNLHYHPHVDLIYMVLKGKVRFYGWGEKLFGEYGPNEGISLPRNARYWFESASEEELHLLQIAGYPDGTNHKVTRVDVEAPKQADGGRSIWYDARTGELMKR